MVSIIIAIVLLATSPILAADQRAEVVTAFVGSGANMDAYRPQVCDVYSCKKFEDVTGTPSANILPAPNIYVAFVETDNATMTSIQADNRFIVLWVEDIVVEVRP